MSKYFRKVFLEYCVLFAIVSIIFSMIIVFTKNI